MTEQLERLVTVLGAIGVLCLIGYAIGQFLRAFACRRKRPALTLATQWRAFAPPQRTGKAMKPEHQHLNGAKVRDLVTGIEGIAISISYHLNGCVRVCIQPEPADNKPADQVEWCDIQQVRRIGVGVRHELGLSRETAGAEAQGTGSARPAAVGGPQKDAPRI